MRPLEAIFTVLVTGTAVCTLDRRMRVVGRWLAAACLLALAGHILLEGAHWQIFPAYAGAAIACVLACTAYREGKGVKMAGAAIAVVLSLATLIASFVFPMFRLPRPTGPYPVGTSIFYLQDTTRLDDASPNGKSPRELMVQLWYPAVRTNNPIARYRQRVETTAISSYQSVLFTNSRLDAPIASSGSPFPVILLNHSWGGRRTNYTFLTEELASHGYVVASIDHTYNARLVAFPDGRIANENAAREVDDVDASTYARIAEIWQKELLKSVADERFVLDRLEALNASPDSRWRGRLNTANAGAIGHSFGGSAATQLCDVDRRVHASVNMDGWFMGAIHERGRNQPLLAFSESMDEDALEHAGPGSPVEELLDKVDLEELRASMRQLGGYRVVLRGASHNDFTDQPLVSPIPAISHRGSIPAARLQTVIRAYVVAFFDKELRGTDSEILRPGSRSFPEASLEAWPEAKSEIAAFETRRPGDLTARGWPRSRR